MGLGMFPYNIRRRLRQDLEFSQWALVDLRRHKKPLNLTDRNYRECRAIHLDAAKWRRERLKELENAN